MRILAVIIAFAFFLAVALTVPALLLCWLIPTAFGISLGFWQSVALVAVTYILGTIFMSNTTVAAGSN